MSSTGRKRKRAPTRAAGMERPALISKRRKVLTAKQTKKLARTPFRSRFIMETRQRNPDPRSAENLLSPFLIRDLARIVDMYRDPTEEKREQDRLDAFLEFVDRVTTDKKESTWTTTVQRPVEIKVNWPQSNLLTTTLPIGKTLPVGNRLILHVDKKKGYMIEGLQIDFGPNKIPTLIEEIQSFYSNLSPLKQLRKREGTH